MATSIPSKNGTAVFQSVELSYPGKKTKHSILTERYFDNFNLFRKGTSLNTLYGGDNLNGLRHLLQNSTLRGKVNLVYIDPPFATKGAFISREQKEAYQDDICGAVYVENLRERLILVRELMSHSGSIYVHLDDKMIFNIKLVMDEVFGIANYRNLIVRKKCNPKNYTRKAYGNTADYILFYTKGDNYLWKRPTQPLSEKSLKEYRYIEQETGRRFMKVPIHAPGIRNGSTGSEWRGMTPPPGKHWQYPPETLDEMDARGEIVWSKNGNPRRKVYLDCNQGVGVQDIWLNYKDAHNQNINITGYPTEKNPELLQRIIDASSNPGDIVLDCYAGSGTTLDVANRMGRYWIGMDNSPEAIASILERFRDGLSPMGDFIQKNDKQEDKSSIQTSLFDTPEEKERIPSSLQCQQGTSKSITDFTLLIQNDSETVLLPIAEKFFPNGSR